MKATDLTYDQLQELHNKFAPMFAYTKAVFNRMEQTKFDRNDPLYWKTKRACQGLHEVVEQLNKQLVGDSTRAGVNFLGCYDGTAW